MTGDIVKEEKVLVIRRIHVAYRLEAPAEDRETVERVHGFHADFCPVARSIGGCVTIETEIRII